MHEPKVDLNPQETRNGILMIEYAYISFTDNID